MLQDGKQMLYCAMLQTFSSRKTAKRPFQQGLGLPKSVLKSRCLACGVTWKRFSLRGLDDPVELPLRDVIPSGVAAATAEDIQRFKLVDVAKIAEFRGNLAELLSRFRPYSQFPQNSGF